MPKLKSDWEAEYYDPVSDAEDREFEEMASELNTQIMAEIELCRRMEEDAEFAALERALVEEDWEEYSDEYYEYWEDHAEVQH